MIPVLYDEISEVEQTLETVIKKPVLRLSDLVKVNQPRLKFGFSFSSRIVYADLAQLSYPRMLLWGLEVGDGGQGEVL